MSWLSVSWLTSALWIKQSHGLVTQEAVEGELFGDHAQIMMRSPSIQLAYAS